MAIDYTGKVTTTGLMNQGGTNVQVPDMRNLTPPEKPEQVKQPVRTEQTTPVQTATTGKSNAITDEEYNTNDEYANNLWNNKYQRVEFALDKYFPLINNLLINVIRYTR